jgi:hypothetical protein
MQRVAKRTPLEKVTTLLGLVGMLAAPTILAQQQATLDCSFRGDPIAASDAVSFHHIVNPVDETLTVEITYQGEGWVGFGISQDGLMPGSQVVIAKPGEALGPSNPGKYDISARSQDAIVLSSQQTLIDAEFVQPGDGTTVLRFTKALVESGELEISVDGATTFVFAAGSSNTFGYHGDQRGSVTVEALQQCVEATPESETPSPAPTRDNETASPTPSVATAPPSTIMQADDWSRAPAPSRITLPPEPSTLYPTPYVECPTEYAAFWSCVDTAEEGDQDREACNQCLIGYWPGAIYTCNDLYNFTCGFLASCPECGGTSTSSCQDELDAYMSCLNADACAPIDCAATNNDDAGNDEAPVPTEAPGEPTPAPWADATFSPSTSAPTRWPECPEEGDAFQSCVEVSAGAGDPQNSACTSCFASYWPVNWECNELESLVCGFSEACPECGSCESELATFWGCITAGQCDAPVNCSPTSPDSSPSPGDQPTGSPTLDLAEGQDDRSGNDDRVNRGEDDENFPSDLTEDEQSESTSGASVTTGSGLMGIGLALIVASAASLM